MSRPTGQLERSLAAVTIGAMTDWRAREQSLQDTAKGEYLQQIQVQLAGVAVAAWGFATVDVNWEIPLLYAPLQRRVPFKVPHFHSGFELSTGTKDVNYLFSAHVVKWLQSKEQWYTGATVQLGACAPNSIKEQPYAAVAHLTFSGYGTPAQADEFPALGDELP
jgi:hypothetical protein